MAQRVSALVTHASGLEFWICTTHIKTKAWPYVPGATVSGERRWANHKSSMAEQPGWNRELREDTQCPSRVCHIEVHSTHTATNANCSKNVTTLTVCFAIVFKGVAWIVMSMLRWSRFELPGWFGKGPHLSTTWSGSQETPCTASPAQLVIR